jgi:hypothetical protein
MWTASCSGGLRRSPVKGTRPGCYRNRSSSTRCSWRTGGGGTRTSPTRLPRRSAFEAQSYEHHSTLEAFAADVERNLELFGEGWMIVPITGVQLRDPPRLVALMARIIGAAVSRRN